MITWESIFPTPVMRSNIGRNFTDDERKFFKKLQGALYQNFSNTRSADTRVLDAPEMQAIRSVLSEHVNQYASKVISASPKHVFYITQSWVNYTQPGQSHHRHIHTNSLISGVLYVQVKQEVDLICFYRNNPAQILVQDDQVNIYNAPSICYRVDVGDLILFPSSLDHDVRRTTGAHTRISLSFNAFIRGEVGADERLNSLTI
jgi:uncharacterized protein (TIGR02466 family)